MKIFNLHLLRQITQFQNGLSVHDKIKTQEILTRVSHLQLIGIAAMRGHINIVKYDYINRNTRYKDCTLIDCAIISENFDLVIWLCKHTNQNFKNAINLAVKKKKYDIAKWIHTNCDAENMIADVTIYYAAAEGSLDIVQWLFENFNFKHVCVNDAIEFAKRNGHDYVVEWLREKHL